MRARRPSRTRNPATSQGARHRLIGQCRSAERQRTCVPEEECRTDGSGGTSSRDVMVPEAGIEPAPSRFEFRGAKPLTAGRPAVGSASRWGRSSVGRVLEWHSRGRGFDSRRLHHFSLGCLRLIFGRSHTDRRVGASAVHAYPVCLALDLRSLPHWPASGRARESALTTAAGRRS